jgi:hypothetical protein
MVLTFTCRHDVQDFALLCLVLVEDESMFTIERTQIRSELLQLHRGMGVAESASRMVMTVSWLSVHRSLLALTRGCVMPRLRLGDSDLAQVGFQNRSANQ